MNTFESIPVFMAVVIIAHQLGADQTLINVLAASYILLRLILGALYLANKGLPKTVVWTMTVGFIVFFT